LNGGIFGSSGVVLGVKELGSKGVKTIAFVYNGVIGR
jgi:hypothetical protein